jgi:putative transposase
MYNYRNLSPDEKQKLLNVRRKILRPWHSPPHWDYEVEDLQRGRHVWFNCFERVIKSSRHFWATINYIHHNPIKHGYVKKWQDWPWSSAQKYLDHVGRETAINHWQDYPVLDYGKNWDLDTEDSLKEER